MDVGSREAQGGTCPHFFINLYVKCPFPAYKVPFLHVMMPQIACVPLSECFLRPWVGTRIHMNVCELSAREDTSAGLTANDVKSPVLQVMEWNNGFTFEIRNQNEEEIGTF